MLRRPGMARRGPGLIGAAARTAVVAGTATAVSGSVQRGQAQRAANDPARQEPAAEQPAAQAQAPAVGSAAPVGIGDDAIASLERMAELRKEGVLTEEEFEAQKAKILGT